MDRGPKAARCTAPPLSTAVAGRAIFEFGACGPFFAWADPVGLRRRRRLIAGWRRGQVGARRLAGELAGLALVAERREHAAENALRAELGRTARARALFRRRGRRRAGGSGGD